MAAAAIFIVNPMAQIVYANSSARSLLQQGDLLQAAAGRLVSFLPVAGAAGTPPDSSSTDWLNRIALRLESRTGQTFIAHILRMNARRQQRRAPSIGLSAIIVRKLAINCRPMIGVATEVHGFTPSEARVLDAILTHDGVSAAAAALGLAEPTVKTHLRHLFEKTGTRRQMSLFAHIAALTNPFDQ